MNKLKTIIVGTGGFGMTWLQDTLPAAIDRGAIEVVAAVDVNAQNLQNAVTVLGLDPAQCHLSLGEALSRTKADVVVLATPPTARKELILQAFDHGCDVMCEKPLALTMAEALDILDAARKSGRKLALTMTHRFNRMHRTFAREVQSGQYGRLEYLVMNFNWRYHYFAPPRQKEQDYNMYIEGAVHHLDILRHLAGADCEWVFAVGRSPDWANVGKGWQSLMTMQFENGVHASYESSWCNAAAQNSWGKEYVRAELQNATLVCAQEDTVVYPVFECEGEPPIGHAATKMQGDLWGNDYTFDQFIRWVNGGNPAPTNIEDNVKSLVMAFAAIQSSETGLPVRVDDILGIE